MKISFLSILLTVLLVQMVRSVPFTIRTEDDEMLPFPSESPMVTGEDMGSEEPSMSPDIDPTTTEPDESPLSMTDEPLLEDSLGDMMPSVVRQVNTIVVSTPDELEGNVVTDGPTITPTVEVDPSTPIPLPEVDGTVIVPSPVPIPPIVVEPPVEPTSNETPDGITETPDGIIETPDGFTVTPDGIAETPVGIAETPDGITETPDGITETPDGTTETIDPVTDTPDPGETIDGVNTFCEMAFDDCDFKFMGSMTLQEFPLTGSPDVAFTTSIMAKDSMMPMGVLQSDAVIPEFIGEDGSETPITLAGATPGFTPTHFKTFAIAGTSGTGIGHQTFLGDQESIAKGKCVRVFFSATSPSECVVFKISA